MAPRPGAETLSLPMTGSGIGHRSTTTEGAPPMPTTTYSLVEIQRGPEADDMEPVFFGSLAAARKAYLERVEDFLAETGGGRVSTVRLLEPIAVAGGEPLPACNFSLSQDGEVIVSGTLSIEEDTEPSNA